MKWMNSPKNRNNFKKFFFFLGLGLFFYLIHKLGPGAIWENFQKVGFKFFYVLLVSLGFYLSYTVAWELFLKTMSSRTSFWKLFQIKIAGEAINSITPLSWGGGDPARILMLKEHLPVNEVTASVVVDRTLNNMAIALFIIIGVVITFLKFNLPPTLEIGIVVCLAVIVGVASFLFYRSHQGIFRFFLDLLKKLKIKKGFSPATEQRVEEIDGHISKFYKSNRKAFSAAFCLHFFSRLLGAYEIYLAAYLLGSPLTLTESYLLLSMTIIINMVFVFIPGTLGVMEGAFAGVFAVFSLNPAAGTSIQIIRRLRMLAWTAIGFAFMSRMGKKID